MSVYPNAGLPNPLAETGFDLNEPEMTPAIREWAENGWLNIIGGCCGTTPEFIRGFANAVKALRRASRRPWSRFCACRAHSR